GHGERQFVDDHAAQLLALDIHTLPETARGKQDGVRSAAKFFQQSALAFFSLEQHRKTQPALEGSINLLHLSITGKKHKGATPARIEYFLQLQTGLVQPFLVPWL